MGGARQGHGFQFEKTMEDLVGMLQLNEDYTAEDDGICHFDEGLDIRTSIKTQKAGGELCLGSFHRIVENADPLLMFVGRYENRKSINHVEVLYLPEGCTTLFGDRRLELMELCYDFTDYMKNEECLNERWYDQEWREKYAEFKRVYAQIAEESGGTCYIFPRAKRDHKKQRRMQCAVSWPDTFRLEQEMSILAFDFDRSIMYVAEDGVAHDISSYEEMKERVTQYLSYYYAS